MGDLTLASPDSPPGVTGALQIDVTPASAQIAIDDMAPLRADHRLTVPGLDPNFPHHIRATEPGYLPYER